MKNNPSVSTNILRLRALHAEMDNAILACYGWQDMDLRHDFYKTSAARCGLCPPSPRGGS
ncbi:MAG: hypothetical protein BWY25_02715 [Chloroflexi bacterium ADurb.Bin222]|nr:MAG: hypothetical protein BWY25_02715 [Chloroflexi bacterium ADurb.Bin222]